MELFLTWDSWLVLHLVSQTHEKFLSASLSLRNTPHRQFGAHRHRHGHRLPAIQNDVCLGYKS